MYTDKIATALIKPAACGVYESGRVELTDHFRDADSIELAPALVERTPDSDTGEKFQMLDHVATFDFPLFPGRGIRSGEKSMLVIRNVTADCLRDGRQIADKGHGIASTAVYHVLTYDHAETVTVIIVPCRLNLDMLTEHVVTQLLDRFNIKDQSLIGRRCVKSIRPVALIENTHQEIGFVIQAEYRHFVMLFD